LTEIAGRFVIGLLFHAVALSSALAQPVAAPAPPTPQESTPDAVVVTPPAYADKMVLREPPPAPGEDPGIPNYFIHIVKILEAQADKPIPVPKAPGKNQVEPRNYPFDDFEAFRSRDMMRAIKEGVRYAADTGYGKTEDEIRKQIEANILLVLQYYPIAAADRDGFMNLWYAMDNPSAEPVLRRILFTLAAPINYNVSLFSQYLQDQMRDERPKVIELYSNVILNELDSPEIRKMAMENLFALRLQDLETLLAKDSNAPAFMAANGRPPGPKDLLEPPAFVPGRSSKLAVDKCRKDVDAMALAIGELIAPNSTAVSSLRRAAREMLVRIRAELPLSDPAQVDAMLAAAPVPAPAAADVPSAEEDPATPTAPAAPSNEEALSF